MKYKSISISILIILFISSSAFGYGAATHTYLANKLGYRSGVLNLHEMYGSVVPDMFNLMFVHPYQDDLWYLTHYDYWKVVQAANSDNLDAFAYGFKSHNEENGADLTAHLDSFTFPGEGYVNHKRALIAPAIEDEIEDLLPGYKHLAHDLALLIADTAVESAIDYLVSRNQDPYVGTQMAMASIARSPMVPFLLCKAYIWDLTGLGMSFGESISLIYGAESQFREYMLLYGIILSSPNALDLMAEQGAELAQTYLQQTLPGLSIDISPVLMKQCLNAAIGVVQNDYSRELAKTLRYLKRNM